MKTTTTMQTILIAGTQSGCGKTSVTLAVLQYLQQQGKTVRSFKTGPDFLDPMWHKAVTHKTSYNLDTNMIGIEQSAQLLAQHQDTDFGVIEGVMGLFDGRGGVGGKGSGAHLAKELGVSVWLVVDAKGMSGSIVPLVKGFVAEARAQNFHISGIIANRLGSENHAKIIRAFLDEYQLPPLIAWMQKDAPTMPERHLGLQMPEEHRVPDFMQAFHADLALMERSSSALANLPLPTDVQVEAPLLQGKQIAIARDSACCFIYQNNLDWLEAQGAKLHFFSPIAGDAIPDNTDAIWLPGGYPELHTDALSQSATWTSLAQYIEQGTPCLAECGGMMMLGQTLIDKDGKRCPMAEILPISCTMQDRLAALGYREDKITGLKGHEYHHSKREDHHELPTAYSLARGDEGFVLHNLHASYVHWYFASAPTVAADLFRAKQENKPS